MTKVKPLNQEQLIYYLLQNVSLGTYDKRFLNNTMQLNVTAKKPVTTNQAELLNKITLRYARQLAKKELQATELIALPWSLSPTQSLPEFTEAFVYVEDELLKIRSPYKTEFVKSLRELGYLTWNREQRTWHSTYSECTLKPVIQLVKYHFNDINFCDEIEGALNTVEEYKDIKYWDPVLVNKNGSLYILAITPSLYEATKHIPLELSVQSFSNLIFHGVGIDSELVIELHTKMGGTPEALELIEFAINHTPSMELSSTDKLVKYLKAINADYVVLSELFGVNSFHLTNIRTGLSEHNIKHVVIDRKKADMAEILDFKKYKLPIIINTGTWRYNLNKTAAKMINLVNSQPVNAYGNK